MQSDRPISQAQAQAQGTLALNAAVQFKSPQHVVVQHEGKGTLPQFRHNFTQATVPELQDLHVTQLQRLGT